MTAFLKDTYQSLKSPSYWLLTTWFKFIIRYRRMYIGPIWIIMGPLLFILLLGALFAGYSDDPASVFIPHMSIGLIVWTLIGGYMGRGPNTFQTHRANLLLEKSRQTDVLFLENAQLFIHFMHQSVIIIGVCLIYGTLKSPYALVAFLGLLLIVINGYWMTFVFGLIGARFKDFGEIMASIARLAFFATPIIWRPKDTPGGSKGIFQVYMDFNPFFHFVEIVRAPLTGREIAPLTWYVVGAITILGYALASLLYSRYKHLIVFWV